MQQWKVELINLDTSKNHRKHLDLAWEAFITSPYANDQETRTSVYMLFEHLKKAF